MLVLSSTKLWYLLSALSKIVSYSVGGHRVISNCIVYLYSPYQTSRPRRRSAPDPIMRQLNASSVAILLCFLSLLLHCRNTTNVLGLVLTETNRSGRICVAAKAREGPRHRLGNAGALQQAIGVTQWKIKIHIHLQNKTMRSMNKRLCFFIVLCH